MTKKCPRCRKSYDDGVTFCPDDGAALTSGAALDPAITAALASDYRVLDCLGSGGMGTVFLAEQIRVGNRKVALKVLHRKFSEDDEFITRFENEAASTGRINHPNVITIYESKQASDGSLYIAMELVEGESLTEHLRRHGRLPLDEVTEIVKQCCKALAAAHRLGIIHRDIKPDNIMLTRDSDGAILLKILDFGIAKLKDSSGHTVTGSVLGTPAYMSYEQASGLSSEKLDGRSDIYSLGIVTYTMLVGHPPFRADTPVGYITKHLSEAPPGLRAQRPDLPPPVDAVVLKALEKDRERRYQAAADFAEALREAGKAPTAAAAVVPHVEATPTPAPPWRMRPTATQTTQVGLAAAASASAPSPPTAPPTPARAPSPTSPPPPARAPSPTSPSSPASPAVTPARPVAPARPTPTGPRVAVPESPSPPRRAPAPSERVAAPVATPPSRLRSSPEGERVTSRSAAAKSDGSVATALWLSRKTLSLTMIGASLMFLLLAAWPYVGSYIPASFGLVLFYVGGPVTQALGPIRFGDWDPMPLALAVGLLVLRPYVLGPLWRLEMQARQRAAIQGLPE